MHLRLALVGVVMAGVAGCTGPTDVVLKNPTTGQVAECKGDGLTNWNPGAATESCAKGYEAAGFKRLSSY